VASKAVESNNPVHARGDDHGRVRSNQNAQQSRRDPLPPRKHTVRLQRLSLRALSSQCTDCPLETGRLSGDRPSTTGSLRTCIRSHPRWRYRLCGPVQAGNCKKNPAFNLGNPG